MEEVGSRKFKTIKQKEVKKTINTRVQYLGSSLKEILNGAIEIERGFVIRH